MPNIVVQILYLAVEKEKNFEINEKSRAEHKHENHSKFLGNLQSRRPLSKNFSSLNYSKNDSIGSLDFLTSTRGQDFRKIQVDSKSISFEEGSYIARS
jgi:hypothetical protein